MKRFATCVALMAMLIPAAAVAQETQPSVTVLGLRSPASEEPIADRVTKALRRAADESPHFQHTDRQNDLAQLMIVFDCEEPTPECLQRIGENLGTDTLIYGAIELDPEALDERYQVTLSFFDVNDARVVDTRQESIPQAISDHALSQAATRFFEAVTGTGAPGGTLVVTCNVAGAQVLVQGVEAGTTGEEPIEVPNLEPGEVTVTVRHPEYGEVEQTATVVSDDRVEVAVVLDTEPGGTVTPRPDTGEPPPPPPPPPARRSLAWLGWTTLGLGVVFGGLGIAGTVIVGNINEDSYLSQERRFWPDGERICDALDDGAELPSTTERGGYDRDDVAGDCSSARTWQALQFVFYGLGAVAVGVGIWLLVREMSGRDDQGSENALRLDVQPLVLDGGGAVSAMLSF